MKEFEKQLESNLIKDIFEFNNNESLQEIRHLYKTYFSEIKSFIEKSGIKLSIEDISNINPKISKKIMGNMLLLKEINKAIIENKLTENDIK